ncbi:MAG: Aspartate 1-decarboxylase [Pelotomaculum thermopropionicum]|uniref:Aspartate 1-decarboxylase n=1 Tax=Pelotomaculum thermopropionicum TaxID=110500 RepID=A0A101HTK6_9FIRM|nr:MAG: Aspartate 1-decarboxylase [Pelotomaculum thermopropionicum]
MYLTMLKSKIHRAVVTGADLNYMGSITIDEALLEAAHILPNEKVQVVNNNNGCRFETYVIKGPRESGVVCLNGAAARLVQPGDLVIIISYALMEPREASSYTPVVVMVDNRNVITDVKQGETFDGAEPGLDSKKEGR